MKNFLSHLSHPNRLTLSVPSKAIQFRTVSLTLGDLVLQNNFHLAILEGKVSLPLGYDDKGKKLAPLCLNMHTVRFTCKFRGLQLYVAM